MIQVVWQIEETVKALHRIQARLRDLRPAWRSMLPYLRRATEATFASQGSRIGQAWAPLSDEYARWKAVRYPGQPILRASDAMFESLVGQTSDSVIEAERQTFSYGTPDRKAKWHQKGGGRLPRRRILALIEEDRREMKKIVRAHLGNQSRASGFERA